MSLRVVRADSSYALVHTTVLDVTDNERIVDAATELRFHIGPHAVHEVAIWELNASIQLLVDRVPTLRCASVVRLTYASGSTPSSQEYIEVSGRSDIQQSKERIVMGDL